MPRKQQGWITFQSSETERQILDQYCQQSQRTKTEILRELVRSLDRPPDPSISLSAASDPLAEPTLEQAIELPTVKISARNLLRATVKRLVIGTVNAEVTLEIAPGVVLISVITSTSAENLELVQGKEVYAVIKSSNVMIAES